MFVIRSSSHIWQILFILTACFSSNCFADSTYSNSDKLITSELKIINSKAPMMLNDDIRFDKAYVNDRVVTYDFTLVSSVLSKHSESHTQYASDSEFVMSRKQQICSAEHFKWYFKYGYSVEYRYLNEKQLPVVGVSVNSDACQSL